MRHLALDVPVRNPVRRLRDLGQRADHRAPHHDDIEAGENERDKPEHEQVGRGIVVLVRELFRIAGALPINPLQRLEVGC